ncbi:unnamed protein product [Parajaminaea phylloscopi]
MQPSTRDAVPFQAPSPPPPPAIGLRSSASDLDAALFEALTTLTLFRVPKGAQASRSAATEPLVASPRAHSAGTGTDATDAASVALGCYVVPGDDWLLPFLQRPEEIKTLLFDTPVNARLAAALEAWARRHGPEGAECLRALTQVDRPQLSDVALIRLLRERVGRSAPDLWAQLSLALGSLPLDVAQRPQAHDHWTGSLVDTHQESAVDDAGSELSSVASLLDQPHASPSHTRGRSSTGQRQRARDSGIELEGLFTLPRSYQSPMNEINGPSFRDAAEVCEDEGTVGEATSASMGKAVTANASSSRTTGEHAELSAATEAHDDAGHANDRKMQASSPRPRRRRQSVLLTAPSGESIDTAESQENASHGHFACLRIRTRSCGEDDWTTKGSGFSSHSRSSTLSSSGTADSKAAHRVTWGHTPRSRPLEYRHHRRMSTLLPSASAHKAPDGGLSSTSSLPSPSSRCWNIFKAAPALGTPPSHEDRTSRQPLPAHQDLTRRKDLHFHRPQGTPRLDDTELLHPQRSKYSFARSFEGITAMQSPDRRQRPKAYSTTQYSSAREKTRLKMGLLGDIPPYEVAAALEAQGRAKPTSLGVLKDGRTRHPSAGVAHSPSTLASFRASLGLSPTLPQREASPGQRGGWDGSAASSGKPSPVATPQEHRSRPSSADGNEHEASVNAPELRPALHAPWDWLSRREADRLKPAVSLTGLALSSGESAEMMDPTETSIPSRAQPLPVLAGVSGRSPPVRRRPGGFSAYSKEWQAVKRQRTRQRNVSDAPSSSVLSTGSQVVASSEGSTIPGSESTSPEDEVRTPSHSADGLVGSFGFMSDLSNDLPDLAPLAPSAPSAARKEGSTAHEEFGLDFGNGQEEDLSRSAQTTPATPATPTTPWSPVTAGSLWTSPTMRRHSPAPEDTKRRTHLIFPVGPCGSRAQALGKHLDGSQDRFRQIEATIGVKAWNQAKRILSSVERGELSDKELLELLAQQCFGMADLESEDPAARAAAERAVCEDVEEYMRRWKAFASLLRAMDVPNATIAEAGKRCAPGEVLC